MGWGAVRDWPRCGGLTTSVDLASTKTQPSAVTRLTETSARSSALTGSNILRWGSARSGMAHTPDAIEYPSDNATVGGKPRTLTKLFAGTNAAGPTRMEKDTCVAAGPLMTSATSMVGLPLCCAFAGSSALVTMIVSATTAASRKVCDRAFRRHLHPSCAASLTMPSLPLDAPFPALLAGMPIALDQPTLLLLPALFDDPCPRLGSANNTRRPVLVT